MSLIINNSPDISLLRVAVTFDLSVNVDSNGDVQPMPKILLQNLSVGANLANVSYAFVVISPSQTYIHNGNINIPDITGVWSNTTLTDAFPMPGGNIEFAPVPYTFQVIAKDSNGNVFTAPIQNATIIRPNGNTTSSIDMAGKANTVVKVQCDQASILFQDTTNYSYSGQVGTQVSSVLTLGYPLDNTNTRPLPFIAENYAVCSAPITFSSDAYEFVQDTVVEYVFGGDVYIRILYAQRRTFSVYCNIDLSPLVCEILKLNDEVENGNCLDVPKAQDKLLHINSLFTVATIGISQPLSGVNVPAIIERIKEIGGFRCNCYGVGSGVLPKRNVIVDGINYIVNATNGLTGAFVPSGSNLTLNISGTTYVMAIDASNQDAFTFTPSVTGNQKTYTLKVNEAVLAADLLDAIAASPDLMNQLNALITGEGGSKIIVDGGCLFSSGVSSDYVFTLLNIPTNNTSAILSQIKVGNTTTLLNYSFNTSTLPALQNYLNSLNLGVWAVTNPSGGTVLLTSNGNDNEIINIGYKLAGTTYSASLSKTGAGYTPLDTSWVIQQIITKICNLQTRDIQLTDTLDIPYIATDNSGNASESNYHAEGILDNALAYISSSLGTVISYALNLKNVTCASIKALFTPTQDAVSQTDGILMFVNGKCSIVDPVTLATKMLELGQTNTAFMTQFCQASAICANSNDCPAIINFYYNVVGNNLNITRIIFSAIPVSAQVVTVQYKIHTDPSYTVVTTNAVVNIDGSVVTPISIPVTQGSTYDIQVLDNCSSPRSGFMQTILITSGSVGNTYLIGNSTATICNAGISQILYTSGAFAIGKVLYTDAALTSPLTGYAYVVYNNEVYHVNTVNGIVLNDTSISCNVGSISAKIGISADAGCSATPTTLYTTGSFGVGSVLYTDAGLTTLLTGYGYVIVNNEIYTVGVSTGIVLTDTSTQCACCPAGYTLSSDRTQCIEILTEAATPDGGGSPVLKAQHYQLAVYGENGTVVHKLGFNVDGTWNIADPTKYPNIYTTIPSSNYPYANTIPYSSGLWINSVPDISHGRLNISGVWLQGNQSYVGTLGFARQITIPTAGVYYVGVGSDDYGTIKIDGTIIVQQNVANICGANYLHAPSNDGCFKYWIMYPVQLTAGVHNFELDTTNVGSDGILGMEVYIGSEATLIGLSDLSNNLLYSSSSVVNGDSFDIGNFYCADPTYQLVFEGGVYSCQKILTAPTQTC